MNVSTQGPWWANSVLNLISVILGAILGFFGSQTKDWLEAKRSRKSFLAAVANELGTIKKQLERSCDELTAGRDRFVQGGTPPEGPILFTMTVFSSQIIRLRNLSDPLLLDIIGFYSTLPQLQEIGQYTDRYANEYRQSTNAQQRDQAGIRLRSALQVLLEEIAKHQRMVERLLSRLQAQGASPLRG